MGLTSQQLTYLKTSDQRFQAHVGLFPAYSPVVTVPTWSTTAATALAPLPMPMCTPRWSIIDNGDTITLYGRDSYNRGGAYVGDANISFANTGGAGSLTDHGDGTASYTAPGGSGTNAITVTVTNSNGSATGIIYVQYPLTTYDAIVAEIASISGSIDQHGWKLLARIRGDAGGFVVGAGILLSVADTWDGTTSTFGGYHYNEGVFRGYISEAQYYEDAFGETWLGIEVQSPWWMLERTKIGQTWWGINADSIGQFYLSGFAPVDAIWYIVNGITDFAKYHNVTLFYDTTNVVYDLIIDESDLGTIITDVMARTVCSAFTDRYGSLLCIPDPDVRAAEWWGTPSPVFDSGGAGPLTEEFCQSYNITYNPYSTRKYFTEALDSSKLGIYAVAQSTSAVGDIKRSPGKLICDQPTTLINWCVSLLAQSNRLWEIDVERHLDHTVDLMNFVDVNFTNPSQTNGLTASGQTWIQSINYRPDVFAGGWRGSWHLLKRTNTDTGGVSAWGGTGQFWTGVPGWSGANQVSSWSASGGITSFCHVFDFVNSGANGFRTGTIFDTPPGGSQVAGKGWSAVQGIPLVGHTGALLTIVRPHPQRVLTEFTVWYSAAEGRDTWGAYDIIMLTYPGGTFYSNIASGVTSINLVATVTSENLGFRFRGYSGQTPTPGFLLKSAQVCGLGADPFGTGT